MDKSKIYSISDFIPLDKGDVKLLWKFQRLVYFLI